MTRQLNLDRDKLDQCYELAGYAVSHAAKYIDRHSTPAIERATLMLLGLEGDFRGLPLASLLVEKLTKDQLRLGAAYWWGRALLALNEEPVQLAEKLARGKVKWESLPEVSVSEIRKKTSALAEEGIERLTQRRKTASVFALHRRAAAPQMAVRFEGTKAKKLGGLVHEALHKEHFFSVAKFLSRDFQKDHWRCEELNLAWKNIGGEKTVVSTADLSVPEQTLFALRCGFGAVLLDGLTPILKGEIDAKRSLVDTSFALALCAKWPVKILSDSAAVAMDSPSFLASLLLYEQMAKRWNLPFENIMLSIGAQRGEKSGRLANALAINQIFRETFSKSFLWYQAGKGLNSFDVLVATLTEMDVFELDAQNALLSEQVQNWLKQAEGLHEEFSFNTHCQIAREAHSILDQTWKLLRQIHQMNLWKMFEENSLVTHPVPPSSLGGEGLFQKGYHYWNPVGQMLEQELKHLNT